MLLSISEEDARILTRFRKVEIQEASRIFQAQQIDGMSVFVRVSQVNAEEVVIE
jgi:hypothetical protein